jgi:N-acetylneuraminic acid mutarotase
MQKGAPVPTPEEEYWNATANGKLYLMGGNQGGKNDRVLEYDVAADKWTTKKPAPWSANHMALAEYRGKIYVFGGATVESQPNALKSWEYDPAADSWKELPPMPSKRTASVAIETGGKIYVIGGSDEAGSRSRPAKRSTSRPANGRRIAHADGAQSSRRRCGRRQAVRDRWPPHRRKRRQHGVERDRYRRRVRSGNRQVAFDDEDALSDKRQGWITFQNRIYVAGGELRDAHMDAVFRDFVVFDPAANEWYRLPSMPTARHGVVLTALGNRIHAVAGHTAFNGNGAEALHSNVNEIFELTAAK